jgi:hypothetical protein
MTATLVPTWGHRYWLIWACITFGTFIVPEVYALVTNWRNTLSASVWDMERFRTGQPLYQWSAGHFLFACMLIVIFAWLSGHFIFGFWR